MTDTITFTLPLSANAEDLDGLTVDALFTAIDHASAYHNHEGQYAEMYKNLTQYLTEQANDQITEGHLR